MLFGAAIMSFSKKKQYPKIEGYIVVQLTKAFLVS